MKTTQLILSTLIISSLTVLSCKKEETAATNNTTTSTTGTIPSKIFTCKIDGTSFIADSSRVNNYTGGFSIIAFKAGQTAFEINLHPPVLGIHSLAIGGNESATYVSGNTFYESQTGNLTILTADSASATASGTFSFTAKGSGLDTTTKTFSEGIFSIK